MMLGGEIIELLWWATTGLKKPHRQNRELSNIWKWCLSMGALKVEEGGRELGR